MRCRLIFCLRMVELILILKEFEQEILSPDENQSSLFILYLGHSPHLHSFGVGRMLWKPQCTYQTKNYENILCLLISRTIRNKEFVFVGFDHQHQGRFRLENIQKIGALWFMRDGRLQRKEISCPDNTIQCVQKVLNPLLKLAYVL